MKQIITCRCLGSILDIDGRYSWLSKYVGGLTMLASYERVWRDD